MSRIFLDTNILVYAYDTKQPLKRDRALEIVASFGSRKQTAVISTQVLQELYHILANKMKFSRKDAAGELLVLLKMEVFQVTPAIILKATELHDTASISFWDALIVCAAQAAGCQEIWTEDLSTGQKFGSVTIVNPLL